LSKAENPFSGGWGQSFGQRREHHGDLLRRSFQPVQGGVETGCESDVTGRASKGLDPLGTAMRAIPNQGMDVSVCDPRGGALVVGAGEALGVYAFGGSSAAFHLAPGAYRSRRRSHS
jgi:hypothetical protein